MHMHMDYHTAVTVIVCYVINRSSSYFIGRFHKKWGLTNEFDYRVTKPFPHPNIVRTIRPMKWYMVY